MPNAKRFSVKALTAAWLDPSVSGNEVAAQFGMARSTLWRVVKELGLPPKAHGPRSRIDMDAVAAMRAQGKTIPQIAAALGFSADSVHSAIQRSDIPRLTRGTRPQIMPGPDFPAMYAARVDAVEIAAHFGVSQSLLFVWRRRMGLKKRNRSEPVISMAEFRSRQAQDALRAAMAVSAKEERAALRLAEMVDIVITPELHARQKLAAVQRNAARSARSASMQVAQ